MNPHQKSFDYNQREQHDPRRGFIHALYKHHGEKHVDKAIANTQLWKSHPPESGQHESNDDPLGRKKQVFINVFGRSVWGLRCGQKKRTGKGENQPHCEIKKHNGCRNKRPYEIPINDLITCAIGGALSSPPDA